MKTEDILLREAEEKRRIVVISGDWPWVVPGEKAEYEGVRLFEGEFLEDGTVVPGEGFEDVVEELME